MAVVVQLTTRKQRLVLSLVIAGVIGTPLVVMLGVAAADGYQRAKDSPVRAMLGPAFDRFKAGESNTLHYFGDNRTAPDFTLKDKDGLPWSLGDQRGKTTVLNFWSITCPPCVKEMPSLIELAHLAQSRPDLEVVAVTTDASWAEVAHLFPENNPLRVLFDPTKEVVEGKYGSKLFPETWIVDRHGVIRLRYDGPFDWSSAVALDAIDAVSR